MLTALCSRCLLAPALLTPLLLVPFLSMLLICSPIPTAARGDLLGRNLSKDKGHRLADLLLTWHDCHSDCYFVLLICSPIPTAPRGDLLGRNLSKDKGPQELPPGMVLEDSGGTGAVLRLCLGFWVLTAERLCKK
jgi:hypothetical protein